MRIFTLQDFTAGLCAGWAQVVVGQPLDLVKTIVQMSPNQLTLTELTNKVRLETNGFKFWGFYKGASSMFLGNGITLAYQFGLNQTVKGLFRKYVNKNNNQLIPIYQVGLSGSTVGSLASLIYSPMEFCKIQMQMNNPAYSKYSGAAHIFFSKVGEGQIRTVYTGLMSCVSREAVGCFAYFTVYEQYVRWALPQSATSHKQSQNLDILVAGSMAGIAFWSVVYPIDTIKTHIQSGRFNKYKDSLQFLIKSKSAYTGIGIVLLRSMPLNAATFLVFEKVKHFVHDHAY